MLNGPTNEDRAARIDAALEAYRTAQNSGPFPVDEADFRDMLADMMHWCKREGVNFDLELSLATDNFSEETRGDI